MYLDPAIRNWVFIPIMIVMILVGILRTKGTQLLQTPPKLDLLTIREKQALYRSNLLRQNYTHITLEQFLIRKQNIISAFKSREYLKVKDYEGQHNPMQNPDMMQTTMDMMKKNMMMVIPQTIIMSWISYFFSGFVLTRLPFPLTVRFKDMLQRGIDTKDMDVTWVSSISWYFLNLFGLGSVYVLLLGEGASSADGSMEMMQMQQGANPMEQPAEVAKIFDAEVEFLELLEYKSVSLKEMEQLILQKYSDKSYTAILDKKLK